MPFALAKLYNGIFKSKYLLKKQVLFSMSVQCLEKERLQLFRVESLDV